MVVTTIMGAAPRVMSTRFIYLLVGYGRELVLCEVVYGGVVVLTQIIQSLIV